MLPFIGVIMMKERIKWGGVGRNQEFCLVYIRIEMSGRPARGNAKVKGNV